MADAFDDLDDETANLIVQLQLQDIADLNGEGSADHDTNFARRTYETELQEYQTARGLPTAPIVPAVPDVSCASCLDDHPAGTVVRGDCEHAYCRECINRLFRDSMIDETLYPPRCCRQVIPFGRIMHALDLNVRRDFTAKREELDDTNRIYCHVASCSTYINVQNRAEDLGRCPSCHELTCTICKGAAHNGRDCPEDRDTQAVLELAEREGWQRCSECGRVLMLNHGCNHMTCICKHEFCYVCNATWQTCTCPIFDEARLYARAEIVVARDPANDVQEDAVAAMADHLRDNHVCEHENWSRVRGRNTCEECDDVMPHFIHECRQCHVQMCRRCRHNRA